MKRSDGSRNPRSFIIIICVAVLGSASLPLLLAARTISTSVNIVNNSSREMRNLYSSHVDADDWSADLLGDATIGAGQTFNLGNFTCDGQEMKIIAEDQDGCFVSTVVACGSSSTWTITNDTARDCGY